MSEAARKRVGFIGVGLMGHGMADNILKKGYPLAVLGHKNRAPVEDLIGKGATEAASPAAMARGSDIVFLCVSGSPQVEDLMRRPDGLIAGAHDRLIVVDCSTSNPNSTLGLAAELAVKGARMVDAPLSRTPKEAAAGTLDTMVGCDAETFADIRPVLGCFATNIMHIGKLGDGHKMKLVNNFVAVGYAALYGEALAVATKAGLTKHQFHAVIGSGRMANGFYETYMRWVIERDETAHRFSLRNAHKDMRYMADMANAAGAGNFIGATVKNYLATAEANGRGDAYLPMLSDWIASLNGVSLEE